MHRVVLYVIDVNNEGITAHDVVDELSNLDIGGCAIHISSDIGTASIGRWHDDHPLNKDETAEETFDGYFKPRRPRG